MKHPTSQPPSIRLGLLALGFTFAATIPTALATSDADAVAPAPACADCLDTEKEHTATNATVYCWRFGLVWEVPANGRCPAGSRQQTIGAEIAQFGRFIDMCNVAAAIAEPDFCAAGCDGAATIVKRKVTATSCTIKKVRDCEPIGQCAAEPTLSTTE